MVIRKMAPKMLATPAPILSPSAVLLGVGVLVGFLDVDVVDVEDLVIVVRLWEVVVVESGEVVDDVGVVLWGELVFSFLFSIFICYLVVVSVLEIEELEDEVDRVDVVVGMDEEVSTRDDVEESDVVVVISGVEAEVVGMDDVEEGVVIIDVGIADDAAAASMSVDDDAAGSAVVMSNASKVTEAVGELIGDNESPDVCNASLVLILSAMPIARYTELFQPVTIILLWLESRLECSQYKLSLNHGSC